MTTTLEDFAKATLNILDDVAADRMQLLHAQGAMINMLEDAASETHQRDMTQRAVVNVLEDSIQEKTHLQQVQRGMLNLMEDFDAERCRAEAVNSELDAFSYTVSHDLRAPVRAMIGFTRILMDEHGDEFSDEVKHSLDRVLNNAEQMGQLVDDLLAFSRLGRQSLKKQSVAPAVLVRQALEVLSAAQAGRHVELTLEELPGCEADPILLQQVYSNLLGNALKYTRLRETAVITVGSEQRDGECVYFVRDNGVGFDMQYADKLFGVFQRLHRVDEYEGTGVGLAIVQRIIHRHGGRVWAEAALDRGATFFFTLSRGDR